MVVFLRLTKARPEAPNRLETNTNHINSWHFTGWRLVRGKQIPWDIWGQRAPIFRYERLGESIRVSHQSSSVALTPALASFPAYYIRGLIPNHNNPLQRLLLFGQDELDSTTGLPRKIVVRSQETGIINAELTASYNLALPEDLQEPPSVQGPHRLTLETSPNSSLEDSPQKLFTTSQSYDAGVTAQVRFVEQDLEGNLHLQVDFTAGPSGSAPTLPLQASGSVMALRSSLHPKSLGQEWLGYPGTPGRASSQNLYLIRRTPLLPNDLHSETIQLRLETYLNWPYEINNYFRENDIKQGIRVVEVIRSPIARARLQPRRKGPDSLEHWCAALRASEYRGLMFRTTLPANRKVAYKKACFWYDKAIKTSSQAQRVILLQERERLEQVYQGKSAPPRALPGI